MKELARQLCDYLVRGYGDIGFVTPPAFANALRVVLQLAEDASPLEFEMKIRRYVEVRVGGAPSAVVGFNYRDGKREVIATGRGRSVEERNLTIPHEFGERLRLAVNDELRTRGLAPFEWPDSAWDQMAAELVSPLARFRDDARRNGLDIFDLAKPLSYEAVVLQLRDAFKTDLPLFAIYLRNDADWERGRGFAGTNWIVAQSAWTTMWLRHGYVNGREWLQLPRRGAPLRKGSAVDHVRTAGRAVLMHARATTGSRMSETDVLIRPRAYGRDVAQVFVVGVPRRFSDVLRPQLQLVDPIEREGSFDQLF